MGRAASAPALAARLVEPEILDALSASDPRAAAARRDLHWINALMFQPTIMRRLLLRNVARPPRRILEIGAGDGRFMLAVAGRLAHCWPSVELTLLDRMPLLSPAVSGRFGKLGWRVQAMTDDVFSWAEGARGCRYDIVTANLILHHFDDAALAALLRLIAPLAPVFVATEPWRARLPLFATELLPAIGASRVTLHDAAASVRAGFSGKELTRLWPAGEAAVLEERRVGPYTHVFAAVGG